MQLFPSFASLKTLPRQVAVLLGMICLASVLIYYQREPSPADYVMAIAFLLAIVMAVVRKEIFTVVHWFEAPLILYLLVVVGQIALDFQSVDVRFALITLYLGASYFVVKYAICLSRETGIRWLMSAYIVGAIATTLIMIFQMVDVYSFGGEIEKLYFGRPNGWFKDSNVAGPFLLPVVYYSLYQFISRRNFKSLGIFLIVSSGVFLSFSRGAYLGYGCGVITILAIYGYLEWGLKADAWKGVKYWLLAIVSAMGLWAGMNIYQPFYELSIDRFGVLVKEYDIQGRAVSWQAGIQSLGDSLFGQGSGNYEKESLEYQQSLESSPDSQLDPDDDSSKEGESFSEDDLDSAQTTESGTLDRDDYNQISGKQITTASGEEIIVTPSAHNTYLRVLLENGIVGLILLLAAWFVLLVKGVQLIRVEKVDPTPLQAIIVSIFVAYLAYLPMGVFIDTLHWRFFWLVMGALIGITLIYRNVKIRSNGKEESR